jgi:SAM-dependent methyltransferase
MNTTPATAPTIEMPAAHASAISASCLIIESKDGEEFIQGMSRAFFRKPVDPALSDLFHSVGLMASGRLTPHGYLVGNVCKEHTNWLKAGRALADRKPSPEQLAGRDVLDVGCSYGRWLWYFAEHARSAVGLEMQPEYITLGHALANRETMRAPEIVCGSAADLLKHFGPCSKDLIFSRLVWNYLPIESTLRQAFDVLRPGGELWVRTLNKPSWNDFIFRLHRPASAAWALFALLNSALFNLTGRQFSIRILGRMHCVHHIAFPSAARWQRMLRSIGFVDIHIDPEHRSLFIRARRPF